ncbi:putative vesicle transport V-snare [Tubulinosema ratisbonensis]|uniref:Putative vesicle transport V-snare n=1 Tax=Tubulinosema ratisbonensis TaxID=291195 RepID=A0A437APK8_9MICR|nr:putative vesicle transport V-snare [Tubulinosema ratisbonensis]
MFLFLLNSFIKCNQILYLDGLKNYYFFEEVKEEGNQFIFKCTNLSENVDFYFSISTPKKSSSYDTSSEEEDWSVNTEYSFTKKGIYKIHLNNFGSTPIKLSIRSFVESSYPADENQQKLREVVSSLEGLLSSTFDANMQLKESKILHIKQVRSMLRRSFFVCFLAVFYFLIGFYKVEKMKALFVKRK